MVDKIVTFGEVMLRLAPPDHKRLTETESFNAMYAGAEANVAIALANLGKKSRFVSRISDNDIGEGCLRSIRQYGVDISNILRGPERLGKYFIEMGAMQRGNKTIYDRSHSAFANIEPEMVDWEDVFSDANWFHWTGITPAVSEGAYETCKKAVQVAQEMDVTVSCDINHRSKLWNWGGNESEVMSELMEYVDVGTGNEEDIEKAFGIKAEGTDVEKGEIKPEGYQSVHEKMMEKFPNLDLVASTLRESISASHNKWSAVISDEDSFYKSSKYDLTHLVDRVGGGDSFAGGLIYGLLEYKDDLQKALEFAVATSALKHSVYGDHCLVNKEEAESLMEGITSGRISR